MPPSSDTPLAADRTPAKAAHLLRHADGQDPGVADRPGPSGSLGDSAGWRSGLLDGVRGLSHGFTGRRLAGVPRELHLAQRPAPAGPVSDPDLVANWTHAIHPHAVERLSLVSQVHGDVVWVDPTPLGPLATVGEGDGLVAVVEGDVVAVRTADCVPVLLAAVKGGRAVGVAAVHAGWRGAASGVVAEVVRALLHASGGRAEALVAAVGPCICGEHYEVGDEVVQGLSDAGVDPDAFIVGRSGRGRALVDVGAAVVEQLTGLGVAAVERVGACTYESPELWSHRRDGAHGGRQAAWIVRVS